MLFNHKNISYKVNHSISNVNFLLDNRIIHGASLPIFEKTIPVTVVEVIPDVERVLVAVVLVVGKEIAGVTLAAVIVFVVSVRSVVGARVGVASGIVE